MKQSLCIIDDYLPVEKYSDFMDSNEILNSNNFKHMLKDEGKWEDPDLLNFVKNVYAEKGISLTGFTSHERFLKHCVENIFTPDIVVFDWDINGQTDDSKSHLLEVLKTIHCFVAIFTSADKENDVTQIINSTELRVYLGRLELVKKEEDGCAAQLIQIITDRIESNFSLKFGKKLVQASNESINKALVELGNATVNQIEDYFKVTHDSKKDLIDFLGEKYKFHLTDLDYSSLVTGVQNNDENDTELTKRIWNYRLYLKIDNSLDLIVRKGDIVEKGGELFLIITADCELARFWHKNFGHLNVIPLHLISKGNEDLIKKITLTRSPGDISFNTTSFVNQINPFPNGAFILPFIKIKEEYQNCMCFPKEIENWQIQNPEISKKQLGNTHLSYSNIENCTRICAISEPFLTPLISHLLNSIYGYGVQDYPPSVNKIISTQAKAIFK